MVRKGSTFESYLAEQGTLEKTTAEAKKRVLVWQLKKLFEESGMSLTALAKAMETSRSSVNRMFDPNAGLTLETLTKAARALDAEVSISLTPLDLSGVQTTTAVRRPSKRKTSVKRKTSLKRANGH